MKDHIAERVVKVARHTSRTRCTVREAAQVFGVSKSTIHKDLTERLPILKPVLAERIQKILDYNKSKRSIRGGQSTKELYEKRRNENA